MINDQIRQLRATAAQYLKAADYLERLFLSSDPKDNPAAAQAIGKRVAANLNGTRPGAKAGRKFNGEHWTQKPENKKKLMKVVRQSWTARRKHKTNEGGV